MKPQMIKIERGKTPKGTALDKKRKEALSAIRRLAESGNLNSKHFENIWSAPEVKKFLYESQHGKCCYCERKKDKEETDVEHFRPKAEVEEAQDHPGYWWLAYNWENLLIACKRCNQKYKRSKFPLKDESKRAYMEDSDLDEEEPIMINPLKEDPELLIDYPFPTGTDFSEKIMVKAVGKCVRGKKTVDELTGINDEDVMLERADKLEYYTICVSLMNNGTGGLRSSICRRLRDCVSSYSEFSGFARFYFKKMGCL